MSPPVYCNYDSDKDKQEKECYPMESVRRRMYPGSLVDDQPRHPPCENAWAKARGDTLTGYVMKDGRKLELIWLPSSARYARQAASYAQPGDALYEEVMRHVCALRNGQSQPLYLQ